MPLKTLVKVGRITNLSDARYCAGMGVDMLGFRVIAGDDNFIEHPLYQQIRGWLSGPKIVAEVYGISDQTNVADIIANFAPDYIELALAEYEKFRNQFTLPFIVDIGSGSIPTNLEADNRIAYLLTTSHGNTDAKGTHKLLLKTHSKTALETFEKDGFSGLALEGSAEIRPGFKDYDELADILEQLED